MAEFNLPGLGGSETYKNIKQQLHFVLQRCRIINYIEVQRDRPI